MATNSLENYGIWNLDLPTTPVRSKLYFLEPIAVGTAYTECLASYICRLAEAHCVSPGVLTKQEILPSFRKFFTAGTQEIYQLHNDGNAVSVFSSTKLFHTKNPNEYGFTAFQYIEGLQPLVLREGLQSLVIPPWISETLEGGGEIARVIRAWCPKCFQQWLDTEQSLYEPLLWSIAAVTVCPYHQQPLQFYCPCCNKAQRPLTGKMQVARCSQCFAWLNKPTETLSESELSICAEIEWHIWVAQQVAEVLAGTPALPKIETKESIAQVIYKSGEPIPGSLMDKKIRQAQLKLLAVFAR